MKKIYLLIIFVSLCLSSNRLCAQYGYIGEIRMIGGNFAPIGWALCDGQLISIADNTALFALIGTTYGGDGQTTFALPDLRGRSPMHVGALQPAPGLSGRVLGEMGGSESRSMTVSTMPSHTHELFGSGAGTTSNPTGNFLANTGPADLEYSTQFTTTMSQQTIGNQGSGLPVNLMQPYSVVNFIIATEGIFPSQN